MPVALQFPQELSDLVLSAVDATEVASAILVALKHPDLASSLLNEAVVEITHMRQRLAACFADHEFMLRRTNLDATLDALQMRAGRQLNVALYRCQGRQVLIESGIICPDPQRNELEVKGQQQEFGFLPVPELLPI